jgi:putative transposase
MRSPNRIETPTGAETMPRRTVHFEAGQFHHVYNRGCNREPIFASRENYLYFLSRLRKYLIPDVADIHAYCLMPNHYHLLVHLRRDELPAAMHRVGVSYSKAINVQQSRVGPLFQGPFQAIPVDNNDYLLGLTRYIHRNPLEAGLVRRLDEWEYSSWPEYVGIRQGSLPKTSMILEMIGSKQRYRDFVEASEEVSMPSAMKGLLFDEDTEAG